MLTLELEVPSKMEADDILFFFLFFFSEKTRLDISYESCHVDFLEQPSHSLLTCMLLQVRANGVFYIHYNLFITRFVITRFWI